jgi:curved DNA-binding protein CbpA
MSDPYEVLGLPRFAEEAEIRRRYLELVRQFSPDRDPSRFAEIRAAYEQLRDPDRLLESQLFARDSKDTLEAIASGLRARIRDRLNQAPLGVLLPLAEAP